MHNEAGSGAGVEVTHEVTREPREAACEAEAGRPPRLSGEDLAERGVPRSGPVHLLTEGINEVGADTKVERGVAELRLDLRNALCWGW